MHSCPYCGHDLKVMPQRKKKCPSCARPIYIKSTPDNREKRLMTEAQAAEAEKQWSYYHQRQRFLILLQPFGLGDRDIENEKARGVEKDIEAVSSILARVAVSTKDLNERKMAFYELALLAEEKGKPFHDFLVEAARSELLRYKQHGVAKVEILTSGPGNSCPECETNARKIFGVDDALHLMPLPHPRCTHTIAGARPGFCRCSYAPALD